jgi:hypothetical protein
MKRFLIQGIMKRMEDFRSRILPLLCTIAGQNIFLLPSKRQNNSNYENVITTAGIPIQELIGKFESEKVIDRQDRLAVNKALLDAERRDFVITSLQDIELSTNTRFAVRRLKMLIHQNSSGMPAMGMITPQRSENPLHFESSPTNKSQTETPATIYPPSVTPPSVTPRVKTSLPKKNQPPILELMSSADTHDTFSRDISPIPPLKTQGSNNKLEPITPCLTTRRPRSHLGEPTIYTYIYLYIYKYKYIQIYNIYIHYI